MSPFIDWIITDSVGVGNVKGVKRMLANTVVLSGASLLMRAISVSFNVYLTHRLGAAALGLFGLMMSVFNFCITLSCSGVRLATTRLTTEAMSRGQNPRRPFMFCAAWGLTAGCMVAGGLYLLSDFVALRGLDFAGAGAAFRIMALGLPPLAVSSAMRGFFLARRQIGRQSAVDLFELITQSAIIVIALEFVLPHDAASGLKAVALGASLSEYAALVFAWVVGRRSSAQLYKARGAMPYGDIIRQFIRIVAPTAGSALFCSLLRTGEQLLIPVALRSSGLDAEAALASLGMVSGMVLPVLYFPSAILTAFSSLLVPELTEAFVRKHKLTIKRVVSRSLSATALFSVGVAGMAFGFSADLAQAVYHNQDTAFLMRIFAPLIPLVYLDSVVDGMLKGLDEQFRQMLYSVLDAGLSCILVMLLIPRWALMGYVATIFIAKSANALLSLARLVRVATVEIDLLKSGLLPVICVALSVFICRGLPLSGSLGALALKLGCCGTLYAGLITLTGGLSTVFDRAPNPGEWRRKRTGQAG